MKFSLPQYTEPDFLKEVFVKAPEVQIKPVTRKGVAPENYHATSIFPEYFKVAGKWLVLSESRMDCVAVLKDGNYLEVKESRRLELGEQVIIGRSEDASEGIFLHANGFRGNQQSGDVYVCDYSNHVIRKISQGKFILIQFLTSISILF